MYKISNNFKINEAKPFEVSEREIDIFITAVRDFSILLIDRKSNRKFIGFEKV